MAVDDDVPGDMLPCDMVPPEVPIPDGLPVDIESVGVDPVPIEADPAVPLGDDIWADAAVATSAAAVRAIKVFITISSSFTRSQGSGCNQRGGGLVVGVVGVVPLVVGIIPVVPLTPGVVDVPGASVPTRPSPIVPAVAEPIGGVTPVDGCGKAGEVADPGLIALPSPDGVVPGARTPAGE